MSKPKINNLRRELNNTKLQVAALALLLDVNESTVSKWNSNIEEPSLKRLNEIGEVLEVSNTKLIIDNKRVQTGLADALQKKYKELLKEGIEKKVASKDSKGRPIMVNNPEFIQALRDFVEDYKKTKT